MKEKLIASSALCAGTLSLVDKRKSFWKIVTRRVPWTSETAWRDNCNSVTYHATAKHSRVCIASAAVYVHRSLETKLDWLSVYYRSTETTARPSGDRCTYS